MVRLVEIENQQLIQRGWILPDGKFLDASRSGHAMTLVYWLQETGKDPSLYTNIENIAQEKGFENINKFARLREFLVKDVIFKVPGYIRLVIYDDAIEIEVYVEPNKAAIKGLLNFIRKSHLDIVIFNDRETTKDNFIKLINDHYV